MDTQVYDTEVESDGERRPTAGDLFLVNLYAAVHCLLGYINELSRVGGDGLKEYLVRYPFLTSYKNQIDNYLGAHDHRSGILGIWQERIEALESRHLPTPLMRLNTETGVTFSDRMALMLAGLVEEDSRFGTVFADLQQPLNIRRPMIETLTNIVCTAQTSNVGDVLDIQNSLHGNGLIEIEDTSLPRTEWVVRPVAMVWDLLRGRSINWDSQIFEYRAADEAESISNLVVTEPLREQLLNLPRMLGSGQIGVVVLRAMPGSHTDTVAEAIAGAIGRGVFIVTPSSRFDGRGLQHLPVLCTLLNAVPVFSYDPAPGETVRLPALAGYRGPVIAVLSEVGGLEAGSDVKTTTLNIDMPDERQRFELWRQSLRDESVANLDEIARRFRLPGGYIQRIAGIAVSNANLKNRHSVELQDVRDAARSLNRHVLDSLAEYLPATGDWSQLMAVDATESKLRELEQRCFYREQLLGELGSAFKGNANTGVRALFTGRSGTGKTLAAKILAAELGMDIYRVDLAAIVNKYIGETEKNLHRVLSRAEALDVILLLDEGDSLLGSRTDVKSANDRHANLETNYLLQRLEHYRGILLITSNLVENIDKAFQRRMDIVIPFYSPRTEQRMQIFQIHLPKNNVVSESYLQHVCAYCALTGGQIRNVALQSTMKAMDRDEVVSDHHIEFSLRSEYRKAGGMFPLDSGYSRTPLQDGGMGAMLHALLE